MFKRFSISLIGRLASAAIQLVVITTLVRALGVENFGAYSVSVSVFLALLAAVELGMGYRILRGVDSNETKSFLTTYALIRAVTFLLTLSAVVFAGTVGLKNEELVFSVAIYTFGESFGDFAVGIFQGQKNSNKAMYLLISRRLVALAPLLLFKGQMGVIASLQLAGALGISSFFILAFRLRAKPVSVFRLLKDNFPLLLSSAALNLAQLDNGLVGLASGPKSAGLYGAANRIMNPINMAISTFIQVAIPELSSMPSSKDRLVAFRKMQKITYFFSLVLIMSSWAAPNLTEFLFGSEFSGSAMVAIAVFISAAFGAVTQVHLSWFYSVGVPATLAYILMGGVVIGLVCIFIFSKMMGLPGSALGMVLINFTCCGIVVTFWHINVGRNHSLRSSN